MDHTDKGSGTQLISLVDLLPEHEGDCMESCPLGTGAWTRMYIGVRYSSIDDQYHWTNICGTPHLAHTLGGCHVPYTWKFSLLPSPATFAVQKFTNPITVWIITVGHRLKSDQYGSMAGRTAPGWTHGCLTIICQ